MNPSDKAIFPPHSQLPASINYVPASTTPCSATRLDGITIQTTRGTHQPLNPSIFLGNLESSPDLGKRRRVDDDKLATDYARSSDGFRQNPHTMPFHYFKSNETMVWRNGDLPKASQTATRNTPSSMVFLEQTNPWDQNGHMHSISQRSAHPMTMSASTSMETPRSIVHNTPLVVDASALMNNAIQPGTGLNAVNDTQQSHDTLNPTVIDVDDDDVIIDEEMTTRTVCIGMIKTDIVAPRALHLVKDEQYEPVNLHSEGKRDLQNYSFVIHSRIGQPAFYGWVPFEHTKILGPLAEKRVIWWDAVIPRGKASHARTPLYIILYCDPRHSEEIGRIFAGQGTCLEDPPFFNPSCRYKNPHALRQRVRRDSTPIYDGASGHSSTDRSLFETQMQAQARREIAQLIESIPSTPPRLKKKHNGANGSTSEGSTSQDMSNDPVDSNTDDDDDEDDAQISGLGIKLMSHQVHGVRWMVDRENNQSSFGGILADMGLGKTIQTMALVISTQSEDPEKHRVTLIVTPLSLIQQWASEIRTKTLDGRIKVLVHHGPSRTKDPSTFSKYDVVITTYQAVASDLPKTGKSKFKGASDASQSGADTEGETENTEYGPLLQMSWYRVVLDEAQQIKNRNTRSSISCSELKAEKRWCLTGTPMQNNVEEIYSLLRFLRIQPLCDYQTFRKTISLPIQMGHGKLALERLKVVLMAVMLRRTKQALITVGSSGSSENSQSGEPSSGVSTPKDQPGTEPSPGLTESSQNTLCTTLSLQLPAKEKQDIILTFSREERALYELLSTKTKNTIDSIFRSGKGEKHYLNMLCMLLRLRQACGHPQLVLKSATDTEALDLSADVSGMANHRENVDNAAVQRALMAKVAADLGWQGVGQVNQSVFDKTSSTSLRSLCDLCGRVIEAQHTQSSYCQSCNDQITLYSQPQNMNSTKVSKLIEILRETRRDYPSEKTIIFSQFTSMLDLLEKPLQEHGFKYCRYDGSMASHLRERSLEALRSDAECRVMLISLKCGSLGLNLTAANRVILMDVWWNPALEEQAIDRVHRIGQCRPVRVVRLVIDKTIEQKIIALQNKKAQLVQGALGDGTISNNRLTMREIRALFDV